MVGEHKNGNGNGNAKGTLRTHTIHGYDGADGGAFAYMTSISVYVKRNNYEDIITKSPSEPHLNTASSPIIAHGVGGTSIENGATKFDGGWIELHTENDFKFANILMNMKKND